jgi:hypothetical protein
MLLIVEHPFVCSAILLIVFYLWMSVRVVGPTEVGLVMKRGRATGGRLGSRLSWRHAEFDTNRTPS